MAIEKMKLRNSAATLTGLVVIILLTIFIFSVGYLYVNDNISSSNLTLDSQYSSAYDNLSIASTSLNNNIDDIKSSMDSISEAENTFQVAWNGLKGLGNVLLLPLSLVDTSLQAFTAMLGISNDFIPGWIVALVFTGIISFVVFLVAKVIKGEPNM